MQSGLVADHVKLLDSNFTNMGKKLKEWSMAQPKMPIIENFRSSYQGTLIGQEYNAQMLIKCCNARSYQVSPAPQRKSGWQSSTSKNNPWWDLHNFIPSCFIGNKENYNDPNSRCLIKADK